MSEGSGEAQVPGSPAHENNQAKDPAGLLFQDMRTVDEALALSLEQFPGVGVSGLWFINSHPKSGTHLLRNILLHFNTPEIYKDILLYDTVQAALQEPKPDQIYMGHVSYAEYDESPKGAMRSVLLLRHPGAIALALARAFYDRNSMRPDHLYMREHDSFEEIVRRVVSGYEYQELKFRSLASSLAQFSLDWIAEVDFVVRFEDIERHLRADDSTLTTWFGPILAEIFGTLPTDAAQRIRAGAGGGISATYSRTAMSARDEFQPENVYDLLPAVQAQRLRGIASALGY